MRLFLSSYRAGRHDNELLKFLSGIKTITIISNAKDYKTPEDRHEKIEENFRYYRSIGLDPKELDLRPFFSKTDAKNLLDDHEFVWLAGGNVFLLRRALKYTGLDKVLINRVGDNSLILGGESAGAIIVGPTLKYSEMDTDEDSPNFIPEGYKKEAFWDGLRLVDYVPVPHYQSGDYTAEIQEYINKLDANGITHKDMTDEQAILINGHKEEFLR